MGCCGGRNKEWVKNIWAHLRKKSPLKAVKHKDANRASGSWNQAVCCQNPWDCTLKSITGCLSCCCILSVSVHYQLLSETAYWARWAFSIAKKSHFFPLCGKIHSFCRLECAVPGGSWERGKLQQVSSSMKLRSQDCSSLCAEPGEHLESVWQTQCGKGNKKKRCNTVCFLFPVLYHLLSVP